jgi:transcriptional regulator with XRE-family HTH domain
MSDIQIKLAELKDKKWTYAAIADEFGLTSDTIEKWKSGMRTPHGEKLIIDKLNQLIKKKPPKQRRYGKGSRK